jgi:hypothetical protein
MEHFWAGFEKQAAFGPLGAAVKGLGSRVAGAWSGQAGRGLVNQAMGAGKALKRGLPGVGSTAASMLPQGVRNAGSAAGSWIKNNPGKALAAGTLGGAAVGRFTAPSQPQN